MEVLNHNQRIQAFRRLIILGLGAIGVLAFMLFTMSNAYKNIGSTEMQMLIKKHEEKKTEFILQRDEAKLKTDSLRKELAVCEDARIENNLLDDCLKEREDLTKQLTLKKRAFKKLSDKEAKLAISLQNCQNQY